MMNGRIVEQVYLAAGPTDLPKSIAGLAVIVQELFQLDPFSNALFVFCNRKKGKFKILFWDHNGFWLYYRRLEKELFDWPDPESSQPLSIKSRQLNWLLDGLPLNQRRAHPSVAVKKTEVTGFKIT